MSESRFPDLAKLFVENNRHRGLAEIKRMLAAYADRGAIELSNPDTRAEQIFIHIVGVPQRLALLGDREEKVEEDRHEADA